MSWCIGFVAKTKVGAIKAVEEAQKLGAPHFPPEAAEGIVAHLELMPQVGEGKGICLNASGHVGPHDGSAQLSISLVRLVE